MWFFIIVRFSGKTKTTLIGDYGRFGVNLFKINICSTSLFHENQPSGPRHLAFYSLFYEANQNQQTKACPKEKNKWWKVVSLLLRSPSQLSLKNYGGLWFRFLLTMNKTLVYPIYTPMGIARTKHFYLVWNKSFFLLLLLLAF